MPTLTIQQAFDMAVQRHKAGHLADADRLYRQILSLQADHADTLNMLALLESQRNQLPRAAELIGQAIALNPGEGAYRGTQGLILLKMDRLDDSIAAYRAAVALQPSLFEAYNNLGNVLRRRGLLADAIDAYRKSIAIHPQQPQVYFNLGFALQEAANPNEALALFERAAALLAGDPRASAEARLQMSMLRLQQGDLERGWKEYEARLHVVGFPVRSDFAKPIWDGSDLAGQTILLHAEQGLGDTIQFIRYAPLVKLRGGKIIVQCPSPLKRLLDGQPGIDQVFSDAEPMPAFDLHCPLVGLPLRFETTLGTIPATIPYLAADQHLKQAWRTRLAQLPGGMKVGMAWSGNPRQQQDRLRSAPPAALVPLTAMNAIRFISLQKRERETVAPASAPGLQLTDWTDELADFADTAALIESLDLIIAVDTAVAHLAGALGKPTWLLLSDPAEWRWLLGRIDSPWYPTMRLFRQPRPGDWPAVIERVAQELNSLAKIKLAVME